MSQTELSFADFQTIVRDCVGDDYTEHVLYCVNKYPNIDSRAYPYCEYDDWVNPDNCKYFNFALHIFEDQEGDEYLVEMFDKINFNGFKTDTIRDKCMGGSVIVILKKNV